MVDSCGPVAAWKLDIQRIRIYLQCLNFLGTKEKTDGRLYREGWWWAIQGDHEFVGSTKMPQVMLHWESNYSQQQPYSTLKRSAVEYFSIIRTEPWTGDDGKKGHLIPFCFDPRWTHQSHPADWRAGVPKYSGRPVRCCPLPPVAAAAAGHCLIAAKQSRVRTAWTTRRCCCCCSHCRSCCCFIHKQDFGIIQKTRWTGSGVPST